MLVRQVVVVVVFVVVVVVVGVVVASAGQTFFQFLEPWENLRKRKIPLEI